MNRIYRLCWNAATSQWVAASELARRTRPARCGSGRSPTQRTALGLLALSIALALPGVALAAQTGGQVVAGSGTISHDGSTTTINQGSRQLSLNWQSFDIGANETVNFLQPGASSIAVNRVLGNSASEIFGHLNANGQVWLINPNGVLFGRNAQVNVGGLVASTLDTSDPLSASNTRSFSGNGKGSVVNQGAITAHGGGYVALLGNTVSNQGTISAQLGTVALGAGSAVTLTFDGNRLLHLEVDQSTLANLAENRQLIQADGGRVLMSAGAADSLLASTVNNTGVVRAQTVENHNGTITLLGGATAGSVHVGGTLDASAPNGDGGAIETSAAHIDVAGDARIDASAPRGKAGTWLIDPVDLTIDNAAATTISASLNGGTSVTEITTASTASGVGNQSAGLGDINVNAAVSWNNPAATFTLQAYHDIKVNAPIGGSGTVAMQAGGNIVLAAGGTIRGNAGVTLKSTNFLNNAGASALQAASGKWLVYSTNPAQNTIGGLTPGFIQYNASFGTAPLVGGNGFLYSVAPTVNVSGLTGSISKTYDGTTTAALTGANYTASGLLNGDKIATSTGTYASANAASGIAVTSPSSVTGFTFSDSTGAIPVYGYQLSGIPFTASIGSINPAQLTMSVIGNPTKTYDGTTTATLSAGNYLLSGLVSGQSITFAQPSAVAYAGASAGSEMVNATFLGSNFVAGSGTQLSNYILPTSASGLGTINQAHVQLTGLLATDKTYDGSTTDTLDTSRAGIYGVIAGDSGAVQLDTTGGTGTFASANAGNNQSVSANGFVLTGSQAHNYLLVAPADLTASIARKNVTINGVSAQNKVYDATSAATLGVGGATLSGVIAADAGRITLGSGSAAGTFDSANAGIGRNVAASGFTLAGAGNANYSLIQPTGLTANITPAALALSISGNPTRLYNGTRNATFGSSDVTITGFKGSDSASLTQNAGASYASANAGAPGSNLVTALIEASDLSTSGGTLLSNYTFPTTITGAGTISPIQLTWAIVGNPTKTYDGNTIATLTASNYQLAGFIAGEGATVTQTQGSYAAASAGQQLVSVNLTPADFSALGGTVLGNYVLPGLVTGLGTIVPAPLNGSIYAALDGPTKTYDGTTVATLTPGDFVLSGFIGSDGASVNQTVGTFAAKDVGRQAVWANLTPSNFTATGSTNLSNYTLPSKAYGTGTINPAVLAAGIIGNPTKVYDGTTYIALNSGNYSLSGFAGSEGATILPSASINFASKNAGSQTLTANFATSSFVADTGTLLSNYVLPTQATGTGTITQAPLYILGVTAQNKVYDTGTAAVLNSTGASLTGLVGGDAGSVTLTRGSSGTFATADAGTGIGVTATGFSISGAGIGNYALQPIFGLTANITQKALSIANLTALGRVYDGTTAIALDGSSASLSGVYVADQSSVALDLASATGSTRSANVGNGLAVTTTGFALTGSQAHNYAISPVSGLSVNITPRPLTANIIGNPTKPYDGTASVTLHASDYDLTGFAPGESGSVPQSATAQYNSANAGSNIGLQSTLVVSDFVAGANTSLSNYLLPTTGAGALGTITPFVINLQGTRVYNALTDADASLFSAGGLINGINGEKLSLSGSGVASSKNVGNRWSFASMGTLALGNNTGTVTNYTLAGGIDWLTITPATLTVGGTVAADKIYDGNRNAVLSGASLVGRLGTDDVTLGNDTQGTFNTKNVGSNKAVATAMTVSGADAGNYTLVQPGSVTASITAKSITVAATGVNKVYNGNAISAATLASAGVVGGDAVTFTSTSNLFDDKNVGTGKNVTVSGIAATGTDAGNYTLTNSTATTSANITPFLINLAGTRIYDAATDADASVFLTGGYVTGTAGETLNLGGTGTLADKNVGNNKVVTLGSLALGDNGSVLASNYQLNGAKLTVTKATLTVIDTVAANKTYDGNRNAVLSNATLNGVLLSDVVTLGNATQGTFSDKNVGTGKAVATAMTIAGTDAGNYTVTQPTGLTANITGRSITVDATGVNKVYDGTVSSTATLGSAGVVAGDTVVFTNTSNVFDSKDVGTGKTVTVTGIAATGTDANNYTLANTTASSTANITPYVINLTGSRIYDTTTGADAVLFGTAGTLNGVAGETLLLSGSGVLGDKNVGTQKALGLGTLALAGTGGSSSSNYKLAGGIDWLTVTPYALTVTASGIDKIYDRTTAAGVTLGSNGVLGGDDVTFAKTGSTFANKNVGTGKAVSVTGISLGGADNANYSFNTTASTTADITPLAITGAITASNKVYDATTAATTSGTLTGVLGSDVVGYTTSGSFSDKNVANGKTVSVSGSISGADAGNYTLTSNATTTANITPYVISLTGSRVYDATTGADASLFGTAGTLNGVAGETLLLSGSGVLGDKNVGTQKALGLGTLALAGTGGSSSSNYTLAGGIDWLTVTPYALTVSASGIDKVYDRTTAANVTLGSTGVFSGDDVTFARTGSTFADKNVGTGKAVSVTGISLGGADKANYSFNTTASTTADITPLAITGAITAANKVYDATTGATTAGILTGVLAGDTVSYATTGSFSDKNVANGKTVTVDGSLGGTDAGNYALTDNATTTADITPLAITGAITADNRVYDADTDATTAGILTGVLAGDTVSYATSGSFGDKNVANGKSVSVSGSISGTDAGNYTLTDNATATADITPLAITGAITADNKVYDATTGATTAGILTGVLAGDTVSYATSGSFSDKNVANGKTVSVSGGISGTDAGNYTLTSNATTSADITPLAIVVDATGVDKVYDGGVAGSASLAAIGVLAGDTVSFAGGTASFVDKNVGNGKAVTATGYTASGADADNYSYNTTASTTANITPLAITGIIGGDSKSYDGSTAATTHGSLNGVLGADQVGVDTHGSFADKNAGIGKTVNVAGSLTGTDAGNYTLTTNATAQADIHQAVLDLAGQRVYDGTTVAHAGMFGNAGLLSGVAGETLMLTGDGVLAGKNVATGKPLASLGSLALADHAGALAGNYTLLGGTDTASITPLAITGSIVASDKVYDGNTAAATHGSLAGVVAGDDVRLLSTGAFSDKNAADSKTVNVSGSLDGGDAGNYTLGSNATTLAAITRRTATVSTTGTDKFYDGNRDDTVSLASDGILAGDEVGFAGASALFADPSIGNGKPVTVSGIHTTGADAGNYAVNATATTSADIRPLASQGASAGTVTQVESVLGPSELATPYGLAPALTVGAFNGNHKKRRQPVEANLQRRDFYSGLSLQVADGGVAPPADAMP